MRVIDDNFMVCADCIMVIANGDWSGLEFYEERSKRAAEIENGIENTEGEIVPGDSENDREFSKAPCECCGSPLAGTRHHCVLLTH